MITGRPPRSLRRSKGKRAKKRDSQKALLDVVRLHDEGCSLSAIAAKTRLPVHLVQDIIEAYTPEMEDEGTAA